MRGGQNVECYFVESSITKLRQKLKKTYKLKFFFFPVEMVKLAFYRPNHLPILIQPNLV
jgi:hypothetical protein